DHSVRQRRRSNLWLGDSQIHNLAYLPPCCVVTRPELQTTGAAAVPRYYASAVSGLYVPIERVSRGHIPEGGRGGRVDRPAFGQYNHLRQLASGDVVAWSIFKAACPAMVA